MSTKDVEPEDKKPLISTANQARFVNYVEQTFWESGMIPTPEKVAEVCGLTVATTRDYFKDENLQKALKLRGVDFDLDASNQVLTTRQLMLANLLMNSHDKKSVREKLQLCGVSGQQYHAWLRQPAFAAYLRKRAENLFSASDYKAYNKLVEAIDGGDLNAVRLFFEMRGIYNPKIKVEVDVQTVLVKVVEVISKHVMDEQVIVAIAEELEQISTEEMGMPSISGMSTANVTAPVKVNF